jgi:hypothetical protein
LGVGEGRALGEGAGVGVRIGVAVGEGEDVGDSVGIGLSVGVGVGVSAAVGVGVLVKGGVEAGTGLSGGRKPGTGRDCFPFTLRVVKREISTAKPTRLVMITITVSRAPRTSRFVGCFEWIEPQAANSVAVVPTRAASIPITVLK